MAEPRGPLLSAGFWLHHAALAWRQQVDARLREVGLTHSQFNLLASTSWLGRHGDPPTQQQVADMAGADRMMTSKVLATLTDRGLVLRTPDLLDTRAKRLTVTTAGAELVTKAVHIVAEVDEEFFRPAGSRTDDLREQLQTLAGARASGPRPAG